MIAAKVKLPGDGLFKDARRILQCSGIVLGAMSGAMPFANGMAPLAAYDLLAEAAAKAFRVAIGDVSHPGGESDPISWSLMVHERQQRREHERAWLLRQATASVVVGDVRYHRGPSTAGIRVRDELGEQGSGHVQPGGPPRHGGSSPACSAVG